MTYKTGHLIELWLPANRVEGRLLHTTYYTIRSDFFRFCSAEGTKFWAPPCQRSMSNYAGYRRPGAPLSNRVSNRQSRRRPGATLSNACQIWRTPGAPLSPPVGNGYGGGTGVVRGLVTGPYTPRITVTGLDPPMVRGIRVHGVCATAPCSSR